jgi:hypothetical protein
MRIFGKELEGPGGTEGIGVMIDTGPPRGAENSVGIMGSGRPSKAERERRQREIQAKRQEAARERRKTTLAYVKGQPLVAVRASEIRPRALTPLTLADALNILNDLGGSVLPAENGVLEFRLPAQLAPEGANHHALRNRALDCVATLDAARPTVWTSLKAKRKLPAAAPAAGGGVLE